MVGHFPYASQHAADALTQTSNRSRSESGSSESSRGSGSTSTDGSGKSRRRSHRPRGCRGGSNRRRNGGEGKKTAPLNKLNNGVDFHAAGGIRGTKFSYTSSAADYNFALQSHRIQRQQQGAHSNDNTMGRDDFALANFQSDYGMNSNHVGFGNPGYQVDFPVLQSSSSELSTENDDGQILPPMPENAFQESRLIPTGPNPYALNLSVSVSSTFNPASMNYNSGGGALPISSVLPISQPPTSSAYVNRSRPHGILQPVPHVRNNSLQNINIGEIPFVSGKDVTFNVITENILIMDIADQKDNHYRNERLEKQRQGMAGGSLFATSPRSFLMGIKTTLQDPAGTQSATPTVFSH